MKRTISISEPSSSSKKYKKSTRSTRIPRAPKSNVTTLTRCVQYDGNFATDMNVGFGWSPQYLWVSGVSTTSINGASDLTGLFEMVRITKVKMILLPTANVHETTNDGLASGIRNIPYVYYAPDRASNNSTTQSSMNQMEGLRVTSFDHPIQMTIKYPKLSSTGTSGVYLNNQTWLDPATDVPWNGVRMYIDTAVAQTYLGYRANFIITFECKGFK